MKQRRRPPSPKASGAPRRCRAADFGSRSRQRRSSCRIAGGVVAGSASRSGVFVSTAASVSEIVSPSNSRRPVSISKSTTPNAQMSARLSTGLAARLLRRHVGRRPEDHPRLGAARAVSVGEFARPAACSPEPVAGSIALASPKSSTFTVPSGAHLDVRRLEIAMDDPLLVRGLERLGDLPRNRERLVERNRVRCAMRSRRASVALDESRIDQRRDAARPPRNRRSRRCSDGSAPRAICASRSNRARRSGIGGERVGQDLDRDVALQLACRARDRPRPSRPRRAVPVISYGTEPRAGREASSIIPRWSAIQMSPSVAVSE